jgi:hypothetical protein
MEAWSSKLGVGHGVDRLFKNTVVMRSKEGIASVFDF